MWPTSWCSAPIVPLRASTQSAGSTGNQGQARRTASVARRSAASRALHSSSITTWSQTAIRPSSSAAANDASSGRPLRAHTESWARTGSPAAGSTCDSSGVLGRSAVPVRVRPRSGRAVSSSELSLEAADRPIRARSPRGSTCHALPMRHRGELLAALAAMGFGSAYVATSFALLSFEPVPAAVWRSVVAAAGAVLFAALRRQRGAQGPAQTPDAIPAAPDDRPPVDCPAPSTAPPASARAVRLLVLAALAGPIFLASMNLAVAGVGATIAAFVAGLYAVLAAVIAPFLLSERLTARVLAGLVLALVGTALLAELDPAGVNGSGMAWGLLAAASFAVYLVLARRWSARYRLDGVDVSLAAASLSIAVLGGFILAADPASLIPSSPSAQALLALVWMGTVAALGPVLMVASVRLIPAARSAAFLLLNPITATLLAAVLLGERPAPVQMLGGLLVLAGIAAATLPAGTGERILARVRAA